jgi:hypothetical protein
MPVQMVYRAYSCPHCSYIISPRLSRSSNCTHRVRCSEHIVTNPRTLSDRSATTRNLIPTAEFNPAYCRLGIKFRRDPNDDPSLTDHGEWSRRVPLTSFDSTDSRNVTDFRWRCTMALGRKTRLPDSTTKYQHTCTAFCNARRARAGDRQIRII